MRDSHDTHLSGHLSVAKTVGKIKQRFYWHQMYTDVKTYVLSCTVCSHYKKLLKNARSPLKDFRVGSPLDRLGIAILGP